MFDVSSNLIQVQKNKTKRLSPLCETFSCHTHLYAKLLIMVFLCNILFQPQLFFVGSVVGASYGFEFVYTKRVGVLL